MAQRRDTLIKLIDATKSSMKFEKSLLTDITKLRKVDSGSEKTASRMVERNFSKLIATMENYPKIASIETVQQLMSHADYAEREIAAARRIYNQQVTAFNASLFQ
ncbi:LemA family protein [bacterium]|nr:LemA family protein [bacterium]